MKLAALFTLIAVILAIVTLPPDKAWFAASIFAGLAAMYGFWLKKQGR